jgi:pyridoxine kinase
MMDAAHKIQSNGAKYVVVKGGGKLDHENAVDVVYDGNEFEVLESDRIETTWTHGAGCTFSAAITAELAKGKPVREAILTAKDFISEAISAGFQLNQYVGPTWHGAYREKLNK